MKGSQVNEFVQMPEFETLLQLCFTLFWRAELACRFGEGGYHHLQEISTQVYDVMEVRVGNN